MDSEIAQPNGLFVNCLYCNIPLVNHPSVLKDVNPDDYFWDKHCSQCKSDYYCHEKDRVKYGPLLRIRFTYKNAEGELCINWGKKRVGLLLDAKEVLLPWDVATKITPQNLQKKLPTILTFL